MYGKKRKTLNMKGAENKYTRRYESKSSKIRFKSGTVEILEAVSRSLKSVK
jgi:hypothetical protein